MGQCTLMIGVTGFFSDGVSIGVNYFENLLRRVEIEAKSDFQRRGPYGMK